MANSDLSNIKESDLYPPVRDYLESLGYQVNGEINSCDIVAKKEEEMLVVEMKKTLNLDVILQATERQKIADAVYIAVVKPKNLFRNKKYKRICHLLRRLEIGLILISFKGTVGSVEVAQTASLFDRNKSRQSNARKRKMVNTEFEKRKTKTTGGVTRTKITTAYREEAVMIARAIEVVVSCAPKDLQVLGISKQRVQNILYGNHYGWFERVEKGVYTTTSKWIAEKHSHDHL